MKRFSFSLVAVALFLTLGASTASAQRSGSMQATAQVIDTRAAVSGLNSAHDLATSWTADPTRTAVDTGIVQVSLLPRAARPEAGRPESELEIQVNYLRN